MWNKLSLSLKEIIRPSFFKATLIEYIWNEYIDRHSIIVTSLPVLRAKRIKARVPGEIREIANRC